MGKGGSLGSKRIRKRGKDAATELVETAATEVGKETARLKTLSNEELFVFDTERLGGSKAKKRRSGDDGTATTSADSSGVKSVQQLKVEALLEKHGKDELVALAQEGKKPRKSKIGSLAGRASTGFDLWSSPSAVAGEEMVEVPVPSTAKGALAPGGTSAVTTVLVPRSELQKKGLDAAKKRAAAEALEKRLEKKLKKDEWEAERLAPRVPIEVATPGQSYRPDFAQHQAALSKAVDIEVKRNKQIAYKKAPIGGGGLQPETLKILVTDDDDSDEEDGDGEEKADDDATSELDFCRRTEKLTRTQRNKQKRARQEAAAISKRKEERRLLASCNDAKAVSKQLRREEAQREAERERINALKKEASLQPKGVNVFEKASAYDPERVPAMPVALSADLAAENGGNLRRVRPKGSLLQDRKLSMASRSLWRLKTPPERRRRSTPGLGSKRRMTKPGKHLPFLIL